MALKFGATTVHVTPQPTAPIAVSLLGGGFLFPVISLLLWHDMHRIDHSLHDFGLRAGLAGKFACYGTAMVGTVVAGLLIAGLR